MGLFSKAETDPVCKMKVDPKTAKLTYAWEGKTYYFCSPGCKSKFEAAPERFLGGGRSAM
jgi:P-type Cu+ transporter